MNYDAACDFDRARERARLEEHEERVRECMLTVASDAAKWVDVYADIQWHEDAGAEQDRALLCGYLYGTDELLLQAARERARWLAEKTRDVIDRRIQRP